MKKSKLRKVKRSKLYFEYIDFIPLRYYSNTKVVGLVAKILHTRCIGDWV